MKCFTLHIITNYLKTFHHILIFFDVPVSVCTIVRISLWKWWWECQCEHLIVRVCLWLCMYVNVWLWTSDCESICVIVCMKVIVSVSLWKCLVVIILIEDLCVWLMHVDANVWASDCESLYVWLWTCNLRLHNDAKCQGFRCFSTHLWRFLPVMVCNDSSQRSHTDTVTHQVHFLTENIFHPMNTHSDTLTFVNGFTDMLVQH